MMTLVRCLAAIVLIAATGCDQTSTLSAISALEMANSRLTTQLEEANKRASELERKIGEIESQWKGFQQTFESEKRQELAKNIEAIDKILAQATKDADASANLVTKLRDLESEILKLRNLCVKHVSESADANQVGQLKDVVSRLENNVNSLKTSVGQSIGSRVQTLEISLRRLESDLGFLKSRVR